MKLTKGKLSKIMKKNKQTHKKKKITKNKNKNITFRKKNKFNLASKTLKNLNISNKSGGAKKKGRFGKMQKFGDMGKSKNSLRDKSKDISEK